MRCEKNKISDKISSKKKRKKKPNLEETSVQKRCQETEIRIFIHGRGREKRKGKIEKILLQFSRIFFLMQNFSPLFSGVLKTKINVWKNNKVFLQ